MKAVIRSDKGVEYMTLLSDNYEDALDEVIKLEEVGFIKADEYVEAIID